MAACNTMRQDVKKPGAVVVVISIVMKILYSRQEFDKCASPFYT